ncbi:MAG: transposase [Albidovulum sp.]
MSTIVSGHQGAVVARRTRRLWTDEEKRSICLQATAPGISVAQVARGYSVNANLIFTWLPRPEPCQRKRACAFCRLTSGPCHHAARVPDR